MLQKLLIHYIYLYINNIKILLLIVLFFFIRINNSQSQKVALKNNHYLKQAEIYEMRNDYYLSISNYENFLAVHPENYKILSKLVINYVQINNFEKAITVYTKLINHKINIYQNTYERGFCYLNTGEYTKAKNDFVIVQNFKKKRNLKKEANRGIKSCNFATNGMKNQENITINHLNKNFNSVRSDFSPVYLNDTTIIFSQFDDINQIEFSIYDSSTIPLGRLFIANYSNNNWIKSNNNKINLPQIDGNITSAALSLNKQKIYYSVCKKDWNYKNVCMLYSGDFKYFEINNSQKLNKKINLTNYITTQPSTGKTYNPNLEIIYFSSDRPDGKGGMDIWFTVFNTKTKSYSEPKNVGSKINTPYDEITPFYNNQTKTLFYSSNGKIGFGGFDIYKSTGNLKKWFPSKNIGYPFNTNANDFYYVINEKQNKGFFVSNRKGSYKLSNTYCCYDIFSYSYNNIQQIAIRGVLTASLDTTIQKFLKKGLSFRTYDSISIMGKKYISNTIVSLYVKNKSLNDSIFISSDTTNDKGEYFFLTDKNQDYNLIFYNKNEFKGSIEITTKSDSIINNVITLTPLKIEFLPEAPLIINNIYYDFNKSELSKSAKLSLDTTLIELLKLKPDLSIEISSHTDNIGNSSYNMKLSEERAENVVNYIILKGISSERLKAVGYGETVPIVPNNFPDGRDNPEGRKLNRRTEFKIINHHNALSTPFRMAY